MSDTFSEDQENPLSKKGLGGGSPRASSRGIYRGIACLTAHPQYPWVAKLRQHEPRRGKEYAVALLKLSCTAIPGGNLPDGGHADSNALSLGGQGRPVLKCDGRRTGSAMQFVAKKCSLTPTY